MLQSPKPTIISIYGLLNPCQLTEKRQSTPNQKRKRTARPDNFTRKSASEHNLSGVGCNFRVFQGKFPEARKIQEFPGWCSRGKDNPGFFRAFQGFQDLLATLVANYDDEDSTAKP